MKIKKITLVLLLIFILAFVLRVIAATHVDVSTDEMVYSLLPLNIISAGRLGTVEQSPLYFYLTDVGYTLFGGLSPLTARLPSIVFGSLAVFVIYLLSLELFKSEKAGLLSAFLFALSGYALQYNIEMDMTAFFFTLLSMLFFLRALKHEKASFYYLAAASFGLAVMVKNIVALFVPAYAWVYFLSKGKEKALAKDSLKTIGISMLIFLVILLPVFSYNYLTYHNLDHNDVNKDYEKITDYYFSNILGIGETVHEELQGKAWQFSRLMGVVKEKLLEMLRLEAVLLLFGAAGAVLCLRKNEWKEKRLGLVLLWVSLIFLVGYVGGQTGSSSHFLWMSVVFSIFAGYGLTYFHERLLQNFSFKYCLHIFIIIALIINLIFLQGMMERYGSASIIPLWKFVHEYIPEEAIVVMDPRIYGGNSAWVLNDRHYIKGKHLPILLNILNTTSSSQKRTMPLYYLECGPGSRCGWKEEQFAYVENAGEKVSEFLVPQLDTKLTELKGQHHFIVYRGRVDAPLSIYDSIDRGRTFWFYPIGWKGEEFIDDYTPRGIGIAAHILGYLMLYLDLILALLAIPLTFYFFNKSEGGGYENT